MGSKNKVNTFKIKLITLAVLTSLGSHTALAAPTGASVISGTANITSSGSVMTITNTPNAIINWASFGIAAGETVKFVQQSSASAVLNRVTGSDPSQILGALQSNGKVFLINPNGIMFGASARIDVNGLVASTLNMTDADFLNGRMRFDADRATPGSVVNAGQITTPTGGFVYLLAPNVENSGVITTPSGEAILAAGNAVEIVNSTDPTQRVLVSATSQDINLSQLMMQSNGNIFSVLNSGKVSANTVVQDATGKIYFKSAGNIQTTSTSLVEAKGDATNNGGSFIGFADANGAYAGSFDASGQNGGFIETSGHTLSVAGALIKASALDATGQSGTWLLDPYDYAITSAEATSLETSLNAGTSIVIDSTNSGIGAVAGPTANGDISIQNDITKTAGVDVSLTFKAHGSITLNTGVNIKSNVGKLNVTLHADQDNSGAGNIVMLSNSSIETNGGSIIMGGGTSLLTDYAVGSASPYFGGIVMDNADLISSDGAIIMQGMGSTISSSAGVEIGNGSSIDSGNGDITINGVGGASTGAGYRGIVVTNSNISSANGNILLQGTGTGTAGTSDGMLLNASTVIRSSGSGNVTLVGVGAGATGTNSAGLSIADNGTLIRTSTGLLQLTGTGVSSGASSFGISVWNGAELRSDASTIVVAADANNQMALAIDSGAKVRAQNGNITFVTTGAAGNSIRVIGGSQIEALGTMAINTTGAITEDSTSYIKAGLLSASAVTGISLLGTANDFSTFYGMNTSGSLTVIDSTNSAGLTLLNVTNSGQPVSITNANGINQGATQKVTGSSVILNASSGNINANVDTPSITANALSGNIYLSGSASTQFTNVSLSANQTTGIIEFHPEGGLASGSYSVSAGNYADIVTKNGPLSLASVNISNSYGGLGIGTSNQTYALNISGGSFTAGDTTHYGELDVFGSSVNILGGTSLTGYGGVNVAAFNGTIDLNNTIIQANTSTLTGMAYVNVLGQVVLFDNNTSITATGGSNDAGIYVGGGTYNDVTSTLTTSVGAYVDVNASQMTTSGDHAGISIFTNTSNISLTDLDATGVNGAGIEVFGTSNLTVDLASTIIANVTGNPATNNSGVLLVSQNMLLDNISINAEYVGLNYDPNYIQTNTADFFNFNSTSTTTVNSSIIQGSLGIGFAGNNVTFTNSDLTSGSLMHGIAMNDLKLKLSSLDAVDEMLLEVGGHLYLDNSSSIYVGSPLTLYFNFPLLASDGWFVDGVANAFSGTTGSYISVYGAEPILGSNFFVTYGGLSLVSATLGANDSELFDASFIKDPTDTDAATAEDFFGADSNGTEEESKEEDKPQQCSA